MLTLSRKHVSNKIFRNSKALAYKHGRKISKAIHTTIRYVLRPFDRVCSDQFPVF